MSTLTGKTGCSLHDHTTAKGFLWVTVMHFLYFILYTRVSYLMYYQMSPFIRLSGIKNIRQEDQQGSINTSLSMFSLDLSQSLLVICKVTLRPLLRLTVILLRLQLFWRLIKYVIRFLCVTTWDCCLMNEFVAICLQSRYHTLFFPLPFWKDSL